MGSSHLTCFILLPFQVNFPFLMYDFKVENRAKLYRCLCKLGKKFAEFFIVVCRIFIRPLYTLYPQYAFVEMVTGKRSNLLHLIHARYIFLPQNYSIVIVIQKCYIELKIKKVCWIFYCGMQNLYKTSLYFIPTVCICWNGNWKKVKLITPYPCQVHFFAS